MIVPEHISATGEPMKVVEFGSQKDVERERLIQSMNVPERIVLTGGNSYAGFDAEPLEFMHDHTTTKIENNIQNLPRIITLADIPYLDRDELADEPVRSENSIAVEENPLQELKFMRRQIGRISARLFQLEEELERHRFRGKISFSAIFGIAVVLLMALIRR